MPPPPAFASAQSLLGRHPHTPLRHHHLHRTPRRPAPHVPICHQTPSHAKSNIDSHFPPSAPSPAPPASLTTWAATAGIHHPSLAIDETHSHRRLIATAPIAAGATLLTLPSHAALIADTTSPTPPSLPSLGPISRTFWASARWELRLALLLLDTSARAEAPLAPYAATLPRSPPGVLWAYETRGRPSTAHLARYGLQPAADAYRAKVKSDHAALRAALPVHARHIVSLRALSWALAVVGSRAFGLPDSHAARPLARQADATPVRYALFPVLDMANHSVHCKTTIRHDVVEDRFRVVTGAAFEEGEEVFLSYGPKTNDDLAFFYGFVEGNNPANAVRVVGSREWLLDVSHRDDGTDTDWERKLRILQENGVTLPDRTFEFRQDGLDEGLVFALRVALATVSEIDAFLDDERDDDARKTRPFGLENELEVWRCIDYKCQEALRELGDFTPEEQERLTVMFQTRPTSAVWHFGEEDSDGELLYRYERQNALGATSDRVRHFAKVSEAIGRICTVLMPPAQSLLRTDIFGTGFGDAPSGIHKFAISPQDLDLD